ncbi:AAA family ATPase [Microbacterium karelineae]|uniref:AAA family ATPase n=1 Tax=Microbacterium karelineae TaxID=2654283 RepID=UPI0018D34B73|nr:AAA family ATPase [Microbacterium karelineae]
MSAAVEMNARLARAREMGSYDDLSERDTSGVFVGASRFDAEWLMSQNFPPISYVIPGILPEGLSMLVGAPKVGKSWFVLDLACAVATGRDALGAIAVGDARPVLYLALEDGQRRLQDRIRALGAPWSRNLVFEVSAGRDEVLDHIHEFMERHHERKPVVFLDTLGKVMPPATAGETDYARDYRVGGALKGLADDVPGAAIVVVHHTRKAMSDDFLDSVSGTQGLAGSADTVIVLRRERTKVNGVLSVTSRDAPEGEYQLICDGVRWMLDGDDLAQAREALAESRAVGNLGDRSAEVLRYVNDNPAGVRAADVEAALDIADARTLLGRLYDSGRIQKPARGLYTPVASVASVASAEGSGSADATHATDATPPGRDATCAIDGCDAPPVPGNYGTCKDMGDEHLVFRSDTEAGVLR